MASCVCLLPVHLPLSLRSRSSPSPLSPRSGEPAVVAPSLSASFARREPSRLRRRSADRAWMLSTLPASPLVTTETSDWSRVSSLHTSLSVVEDNTGSNEYYNHNSLPVLEAGQEFHRRCPTLWPGSPTEICMLIGQSGLGAPRSARYVFSFPLPLCPLLSSPPRPQNVSTCT